MSNVVIYPSREVLKRSPAGLYVLVPAMYIDKLISEIFYLSRIQHRINFRPFLKNIASVIHDNCYRLILLNLCSAEAMQYI